MKEIKLAFTVLTLAIILYSCKDQNPIENEIITKNSVALRTVLNRIKIDNDSIYNPNDSVNNTNDSICRASDSIKKPFYNFIFPLDLSYNNSAQVSVASLNGLKNLLTDENENLFIKGISFPFEITSVSNNNSEEINNESEFNTLNNNFDFITINDMVISNCFSLIYPVIIIDENGNSVSINNENQLYNLIDASPNSGNNSGSDYQLDFVFPISINYNGGNVVINDIYQLFELFEDCNMNQTVCPAVYDPVCVQTTTGIQQYNNACLAECAGYTSTSFINCSNNTNLEQLLNTCFAITYPVEVIVQNTAQAVNNNNELLSLSVQNQIPDLVYPIEITFFNQNPQVALILTINSLAELQTAINTHCN